MDGSGIEQDALTSTQVAAAHQPAQQPPANSDPLAMLTAAEAFAAVTAQYRTTVERLTAEVDWLRNQLQAVLHDLHQLHD